MNYTTSRVEFDKQLGQYFVGEMVFDVTGLYAYFEKITDLRDRRGVRYQLADILTLILLAKLGGEDTVRGMAGWLKNRIVSLSTLLGFKRQSTPHQTTISRILGYGINVDDFERVLQRYFDRQTQGEQEVVIAIDGKTLRGTIPRGQTRGIHLLAAYLPTEGVVLCQVEVDSKENEISAAPRLLQTLELRGKIVIGDAMHTQRAISVDIVRAGGDYIWTTKGNQAEVQATIARLFEPELVTPGFSATPTDFQTATTINKGHGRLEKRAITTSSMLNDYLNWPYVAQVFKLERRATDLTTGEISTQIVYGLTSLSAADASPRQLMGYIRAYWHIENGLHYRRDVTFKEDACRLRIGSAARMMASLNNLALALMRRHGHSNIPDARRRYAAHPKEALQLIMQQP